MNKRRTIGQNDKWPLINNEWIQSSSRTAQSATSSSVVSSNSNATVLESNGCRTTALDGIIRTDKRKPHRAQKCQFGSKVPISTDEKLDIDTQGFFGSRTATVSVNVRGANHSILPSKQKAKQLELRVESKTWSDEDSDAEIQPSASRKAAKVEIDGLRTSALNADFRSAKHSTLSRKRKAEQSELCVESKTHPDKDSDAQIQPSTSRKVAKMKVHGLRTSISNADVRGANHLASSRKRKAERPELHNESKTRPDENPDTEIQPSTSRKATAAEIQLANDCIADIIGKGEVSKKKRVTITHPKVEAAEVPFVDNSAKEAEKRFWRSNRDSSHRAKRRVRAVFTHGKVIGPQAKTLHLADLLAFDAEASLFKLPVMSLAGRSPNIQSLAALSQLKKPQDAGGFCLQFEPTQMTKMVKFQLQENELYKPYRQIRIEPYEPKKKSRAGVWTTHAVNQSDDASEDLQTADTSENLRAFHEITGREIDAESDPSATVADLHKEYYVDGRDPLPSDLHEKPLNEILRELTRRATKGFDAPYFQDMKSMDRFLHEDQKEFFFDAFNEHSYLQFLPETATGIKIHTGYVSIGSLAVFSLHTEDSDLDSLNLMDQGYKMIFIIPASEKPKVLALLRKLYGYDYRFCDAAERHKCFWLHPAWFALHGIKVFYHLQKPGELIYFNPSSFHFGFSLSRSVAIAFNSAFDAWLNTVSTSIENRCNCAKSKTADSFGVAQIAKIRQKAEAKGWKKPDGTFELPKLNTSCLFHPFAKRRHFENAMQLSRHRDTCVYDE